MAIVRRATTAEGLTGALVGNAMTFTFATSRGDLFLGTIELRPGGSLEDHLVEVALGIRPVFDRFNPVDPPPDLYSYSVGKLEPFEPGRPRFKPQVRWLLLARVVAELLTGHRDEALEDKILGRVLAYYGFEIIAGRAR